MNLFKVLLFFGVNILDMIFSTIVNLWNVAEWSKIVLLYQLHSVLLLLILKIYHLFNKFEIFVVIAIPKFAKVHNLTKVL